MKIPPMSAILFPAGMWSDGHEGPYSCYSHCFTDAFRSNYLNSAYSSDIRRYGWSFY